MGPEEEQDQNRMIPRHEKAEKGQEKQDEKGQGPDEKYERNPVGYLMFAVLLFWIGVFFLLRNRHYFPETDRGWAILVWGGAALAFLEIAIRFAVPRFRRALTGTFVWAAILTGVGAGLWTGGDWAIIGPLILIAVGIALIAGRLLPRR